MKVGILIKRKSSVLRASKINWVGLVQVLLGSAFLGLMAQLAIQLPFTPVPLSMQSLGVALLAISLGSRKAAWSVAVYLIQATVGLPVLGGGLSNPLWMVGPRMGYLIGFVVAAFIVGRLLEQRQSSSFLKNWLILSLNEGIILLMGTLWLGLFVGWGDAFALGTVPFLSGALIKITIAASSIKPIEWLKS
ncbi:MAG: biotin transporter BioY [Chlamydiales bacterium]